MTLIGVSTKLFESAVAAAETAGEAAEGAGAYIDAVLLDTGGEVLATVEAIGTEVAAGALTEEGAIAIVAILAL